MDNRSRKYLKAADKLTFHAAMYLQWVKDMPAYLQMANVPLNVIRFVTIGVDPQEEFQPVPGNSAAAQAENKKREQEAQNKFNEGCNLFIIQVMQTLSPGLVAAVTGDPDYETWSVDGERQSTWQGKRQGKRAQGQNEKG